jgi:hypothetical protein
VTIQFTVSTALGETRMSALGAAVAMDPTSGSHAPSVEAVFSARLATYIMALHTSPASSAIYSIDG